VRERWNQHAKCGLDIDTPQGNKLYQAMLKDGLENFSFQLLEECPRDELNKKENYYINMYNSCEFGYNSNTGIKDGN
jgi:group I intron endonuclease